MKNNYHRRTLILCVATALTTSLTAQSPANGYVDGYGYVDLGLSVKWATCNVGAGKPEDYGDYFAWGEAETKETYTEGNSMTYNRETYDYVDAATSQLGAAWRTPTHDEMMELIDKCKWTWTTVNGIAGYIVKSRRNGNSIFLPAAGGRMASMSSYVGEWGYYWTSETDASNPRTAGALQFYRALQRYAVGFRFGGQTVRPVTQ